MKISSVRDLKQELKAGPAAPEIFVHAFAAASRAAVARRAADAHTRRPQSESVALGIAKGKRAGEYILSARIQARGTPSKKLAETIMERSRGECDMRFVPEVRKRRPGSWFQKRRRPLEAGLSVSVATVEAAGTLGFIVEDQDAYYVLSNNHVLANVNEAEPGDPVVQPGPLDRPATEATLIGVLDRFVPISFSRSNVVDCAVAQIFDDVDFYAGWTEAIPGVVKGVRKLTEKDLGKHVFKAGRTTGVREGIITSVEVDRLQVDMADEGEPEKIALFSDQIEVIGTRGLFSDAGDSGSLIVDATGRAVALLFSGGSDDQGNDLTFANRIERVLQKLGVKLTL